MMLATMSADEIRKADRTLAAGTWTITFGAILFSVLTVTPLVMRVTPGGWTWTAPILPIVVDAAVVIVVRLDAVVSRLNGDAGRWPVLLRWLTGLMTLALNVGDSALSHDWVGVAVHSVAPLLLIVTAEAGLAYRRAIAQALARIAREQDERADRERREREVRERREREERERERQERERERERQEHADRERREQEHADREREREHAAQLVREEREHDARMERERAEREDARRREEQERADRERERERQAKEAAQKAERDRKAAEARKAAPVPVSAAVSTPRPTVSTTVSKPVSTARKSVSAAAHDSGERSKMPEADARRIVAEAVRDGRSQRQMVALTGWSTGWVAARVRELRDAQPIAGQTEIDTTAAA